MRLCYVLASPTWGMHQYTADLANRQRAAGHEVHLVTTRQAPRDRYGPGVRVHTPIATRNSGFSPDALRLREMSCLQGAVLDLKPDLVHITGPHLWNPPLLGALRQSGVPSVHSLHDLHPHTGAAYGRLLYLWNDRIQRDSHHLLVHGRCHRAELVAKGTDPARLTCTPLTHLFVSHARQKELVGSPPQVRYEPWALFLGRLEAYKGLDVLVEAARQCNGGTVRVIIAGRGSLERVVAGEMPANVQIRNRLIQDAEAVELFRRCGMVVLPYREASQSALVAAAYFFRKPVIVTKTGALPEYVVQDGAPGRTGWVVPAGNAAALGEAMAEALEDPERLAQLGEAGRAWYDQQRSAEGRALAAMYRALAVPERDGRQVEQAW